ncbi:hypothetical protein [Streptomyces orinoci]|uniref:Uncharacterized protein n=1 Tax=Streptomyces orinoci TaxID=67339 RepID=A0ABV3K2R8_STRON|nr:hypothetical protein [Streptomyces orinoci]
MLRPHDASAPGQTLPPVRDGGGYGGYDDGPGGGHGGSRKSMLSTVLLVLAGVLVLVGAIFLSRTLTPRGLPSCSMVGSGGPDPVPCPS